MNNIISINSNKFLGFTKSEPESCSLLELCMNHEVKVFEIESKSAGNRMIVAHFKKGKWTYLYHDGDSILTKNYFFYFLSYDDCGISTSPEDQALNFFDNEFILTD